MKIDRNLVCFITFVLFLPATFAQSFVGEIRGLILDPGGAIIGGAELSLKNEATGTVRSTVSNSSGQYVFAQLEPATYTITGLKLESAKAPVDVLVIDHVERPSEN